MEVRRDLGNTSKRVASNRIIRCAPNFSVSLDETALYVGECFSPNSIYKLDLTQDDAPIVAEDNHGSISGSYHLEVSPDGSRLYNGGGQILDTGDLTQVGLIGGGSSRLTADGQLAYVATTQGTVEVYDVPTMLLQETLTFACSGSGVDAIQLLPNDSGVVVLSGDHLCGASFDPAPIVSLISPDRLPWDEAPELITIQGSRFTGGSGLTVELDGVPASSVIVLDDSNLLVTPAAPLEPGYSEVTVRHSEGEATIANGFAWTPALSAAGSATIGESFTLNFLLSQTDAVIAYFGLPPQTELPIAGIGGALCIPTPTLLLSSPAWPYTTLNLQVDVPDDPSLSGLTCLFQGVAGPDLTVGGQGGFTDCVTITIQ